MTDIRYVAPRTLDEAIGAFAAAGSAARIMAGGTDLLVQMRSGMALAEHPKFGKVWPGVLEAVNLIGSKQVQ